MITW
jgi:hypothetical protein